MSFVKRAWPISRSVRWREEERRNQDQTALATASGNKRSFEWSDDIAVDGAGNIFIADTFNSLIRKVAAATGIISVVAGGGTNAGTDGIDDGGPATGARLARPVAIGLDG